ncbi:hypothetical protein ACIGNX_23200 [Actinosynnema sp. NPDC053489]|uniref:hypothetical protein n=1 Tax=Actinosynnema sp. NPDC053489 TaxID=3363916 RepID=UPI0037C9CC36
MRMLSVIPTVVATTFLLATGCSKLSTEQKYEHLRDVANKGADAHFVLVNENKETSREVCEQHYKVFVPDGAPNEGGYTTKEWEQLSLDYFIDSCVKGEPRTIQTRPESTTPITSST